MRVAVAVGAARMHEQERTELLCLRPEHVVLGVREVLRPGPPGGNAAALESETLDAVFERLRCEVGKLQRHRRHADEAIRILRDDGGRPVVLRLDDGARELAVLDGVPPCALLREELKVDAGLVHLRDTRSADDPVARRSRLPLEGRALHDVGNLGNVEMRVRIDHLDPLAADEDLAPLRRGALRGLRERVVREAAGDAHARCRRCDGFDEVSSIAHHILLIRRPVKGALHTWNSWCRAGLHAPPHQFVAVNGSVKTINVSDDPPPQFGLPAGTNTACPSETA